jgi:hypothetical protein
MSDHCDNLQHTEERLWNQLSGIGDTTVVPELMKIFKRRNDPKSAERLAKELNRQIDELEAEVLKRKNLTREILYQFFPF